MKITRMLAVGISLVMLVACGKHNYSLDDASEAFSQPVVFNTKVDMVIVVDNSSSMSQYQDKLAAQIPGMIRAFSALGMDYNIVVVSSDMRSGGNGGMFIGEPKVLRYNQSNLGNILSARIRLGNGGSDLERGIQSMQTALSPEYLAGAGAGFFRSDALLAIVVLSNEDDYSSASLSSVKAWLDDLKPNFNGSTKAWILNFIGVPNLASSCDTALDGGYKEPGIRWIDLANYSGGIIAPICDNSLAAAVSNVKKRIVQVIPDYKLSRKPKIETIKVFINGSEIPQSTDNGWEYVEEGNLIRFHGDSIPGPDDELRITFSPETAS